MEEFAEIYGEWSEYYCNYKWKKLTTAASYYGYNFDNVAHDSLEDIKATLVVYNAIRNNMKPYNGYSMQLLNENNDIVFESDDIIEVIEKSNELYGRIELNKIRKNWKKGLSFEHFIKQAADKKINIHAVEKTGMAHDFLFETALSSMYQQRIICV